MDPKSTKKFCDAATLLAEVVSGLKASEKLPDKDAAACAAPNPDAGRARSTGQRSRGWDDPIDSAAASSTTPFPLAQLPQDKGSVQRKSASSEMVLSKEHAKLFGYSASSSSRAAGGGRPAKRRRVEGRGRSSSSPREWRHVFVCLPRDDITQIPEPDLKLKMQKAGLGEKELVIPCDADSLQVHEIILQAFPALQSTGYKLLRTTGHGRKSLEEFGFVTGADVLHVTLRQAKCYLRPIVGKLDLTSLSKEEDAELITVKCKYCNLTQVMSELEEHVHHCRSMSKSKGKKLVHNLDRLLEESGSGAIRLKSPAPESLAPNSPAAALLEPKSPATDDTVCTIDLTEQDRLTAIDETLEEWRNIREEQDVSYYACLVEDERKDNESQLTQDEETRRETMKRTIAGLLSSQPDDDAYDAIHVKVVFPNSDIDQRRFQFQSLFEVLYLYM
eukprot:m.229766 g.229766  ORF g.229766 m.229766 type:complete len:446 (+) comp40049_c0_seq44:98-1435(+)